MGLIEGAVSNGKQIVNDEWNQEIIRPVPKNKTAISNGNRNTHDPPSEYNPKQRDPIRGCTPQANNGKSRGDALGTTEISTQLGIYVADREESTCNLARYHSLDMPHITATHDIFQSIAVHSCFVFMDLRNI